LIKLQAEPIEVADLIAAVSSPGEGAIALFLGTVRDNNRGRRVIALEYQAFDEMALREMTAVAKDAAERFGLFKVALVHRTGRLDIGEVAVGVAVAAPHRKQSFDGCRFVIDELKVRVPIWKKEFYEGGSVWLEGGGDDIKEDR
jgi:molybdopterin synthase catalytic subunit